MKTPCNEKCEIMTRIVGYYSGLNNWNKGKREEYKMRKTFKINQETELDEDPEQEEKNVFEVV